MLFFVCSSSCRYSRLLSARTASSSVHGSASPSACSAVRRFAADGHAHARAALQKRVFVQHQLAGQLAVKRRPPSLLRSSRGSRFFPPRRSGSAPACFARPVVLLRHVDGNGDLLVQRFPVRRPVVSLVHLEHHIHRIALQLAAGLERRGDARLALPVFLLDLVLTQRAVNQLDDVFVVLSEGQFKGVLRRSAARLAQIAADRPRFAPRS